MTDMPVPVSATSFRQLAAALRLPLLLLLGLLTVSCGTLDYVPPSTDAGRECVAICAHAKQNCQIARAEIVASERGTCQAGADYALSDCLASADSDAARSECHRQVRDCGQVAVEGLSCEADFDRCYQDCGGVVFPFGRPK